MRISAQSSVFTMIESTLQTLGPVNVQLPRRRRQFLKHSSNPVTTVEANGTAYLCFSKDHSWFQGNISTEDESNYSLYGERVQEEKVVAANALAEKINQIHDEENNSSRNAGEYYRVTMIDHFSGLKHTLPNMYVKKVSGCQLFASSNGEVTFQVENVYKGQKAEMMIQRFVGSPSHLGNKCMLYTGPINILFDEAIEIGKSWSL